jgi:TPR repeat protein
MQGHPMAAFNLGVWYMEGTRTGTDRDLNTARHFFEQSAEDGCGMAQALLGRMHERGVAGFVVDPKRAWQLYKKAIKDPRVCSADPFVFAGLCYQRGVGVKKDSKKAIQMLRKADKFEGALYTFVMDAKYRIKEPEPDPYADLVV